MKTTALLVILLLALGVSLAPAPALAADQAVIQALPETCQPVSETELSQLNGKFRFSFDKATLIRAAFCAYKTYTPPETQERICRVVQKISYCFRPPQPTAE